MVGSRLTFSVLAVAPLLMSAAASAADYSYPPPAPPPQVYQPPPMIIQQPAPEFAGDWYLRGQIGMGIAGYNKFEISPLNPGDIIAGHSMTDHYFIGGGVGYEWNSWLRFDATVEYRFKSSLYALGFYPGPPAGTDNYHGQMSSWVFLANGYVDLGTWDCFTPFIGAGIGFARNSITNLVDENAGAGTYGIGRDTAKWNFAWALYAGVTYNVSKAFKVDLTYRYLNLGSAQDMIDCAGGCGGYKFEYKNIYSHDFMIAFRWLCCETAPPPPKYVYMPPPPVYQPPPPPLRSKG
jgi:opacity protein-like surface antigen